MFSIHVPNDRVEVIKKDIRGINYFTANRHFYSRYQVTAGHSSGTGIATGSYAAPVDYCCDRPF